MVGSLPSPQLAKMGHGSTEWMEGQPDDALLSHREAFLGWLSWKLLMMYSDLCFRSTLQSAILSVWHSLKRTRTSSACEMLQWRIRPVTFYLLPHWMIRKIPLIKCASEFYCFFHFLQIRNYKHFQWKQNPSGLCKSYLAVIWKSNCSYQEIVFFTFGFGL